MDRYSKQGLNKTTQACPERIEGRNPCPAWQLFSPPL